MTELAELTESGCRSVTIDWQQCDTVLLDMDGTLLDLSFDNYFWRELVPRCLARARAMDPDRARDELFERYADVHGSLKWYCLDYWSEELQLDLRTLKAASSHRVRFLPGAREFLIALAGRKKRIVIVTNAHAETLRVKRGVLGLDRFLDEFVSSHELGYAKEHAGFWPLLRDRLGFDPDRTLFVDDSVPVLDAATAFGVGHVVAVTGADSGQPDHESGRHASVRRVVSLI